MNDEENEDSAEYYIATELFCKKHDLPYNEKAANRSAISHDEATQILKNIDFNNTEEVSKAFICLIKDRYIKELKLNTN